MPTLADIFGAIDATKRGLRTNPEATIADWGRGAAISAAELGDLLHKAMTGRDPEAAQFLREYLNSSGTPVEGAGGVVGIPGLGTAATAAKGLSLAGIMAAVPKAAAKSAAKGGEKAALKKVSDLTPMPEMAERYPQTMHPVSGYDEKKAAKGKFPWYPKKQLGEEAQRVSELRDAAQADIDAGNYTPQFDISKRENVPKGTYTQTADTRDVAIPKTFSKFDEWVDEFDTPEVRQRLRDAFHAGKGGEDWYAAKQLYDAYVKELGPEAGKQAFEHRFADMMAATTGGSDPTANLLTAHLMNYYKEKGIPIPRSREYLNKKGQPTTDVASYDIPFPVGGRYVGGNIDMGEKLNAGIPISASDQPKRFNFSGNFKGHTGNSTLDEQMEGLYDASGKLKAPPGDSYGIQEEILADEAKQMGVEPMNFQDVAWLGAKRLKSGKLDEKSKPIMQHINELLERTRRVTGKSQEEVLRGYIRANMPAYGVGGITLGELLRRGMPEEEGTQ